MTIEGLAEEVERYNTIYHHYSRIREGEKCYDSLLRSGKVECRAGGAAGTSSGNRDQAAPTELGICAHSLAADIAATRKRVEETTRSAPPATGIESEIGGGDSSSEDLISRVSVLETENREMRSEIQDLRVIIEKLQAKVEGHVIKGDSKPAEKEPAKEEEENEEEDIDLFGSDEEEDEEKEKIKEARVKAYEAKKEKKPGAVAKSSVILDVKPWDDETDMKEIESVVRSIDMDGLLWGASKLVPLAYGVKKLQIMCVVEDEKVSVDELTEKIEEHEDLVQSVDIAAFNKI